MHNNRQPVTEMQTTHAVFFLLGLIFLISAVGGDGLASYGMGLGLLLMGIFGLHRDQIILGRKVDRGIYIVAALVVILTGAVQLTASVLEAIRILRGV